MATGDARVEIGAVQAAWDQACVLRSQDALEKWPGLSRSITAATAIHSADELHRGTVLLLGSALGQIGAGSPAGRRNAERFTSTLMTKVGQWAGTEAVERSDLPMVRQAVTVAFEGRDPVAWRDRATGPRQRTTRDDLRTRIDRGLRGPDRRTRIMRTHPPGIIRAHSRLI
ncbi:hypothetical protein [Streptomyces sp. NBC_00654]|uniref:hypothetical protein n=1 Tax=Streptomyces sp. NBC_00654 TaxID=2975799 RepID=UPI00224D02D6|nr:hypothetical protein [Streptomyces sp. NBC_00654]MCX4967022.1 hypothetical protein [Streptomyces sp. NBC_00654]